MRIYDTAYISFIHVIVKKDRNTKNIDRQLWRESGSRFVTIPSCTLYTRFELT